MTKVKGLIFTTNGYCFSLIWAKQNVFRFDSHSRNKEGSLVESGSSIPLAFKTLSDVETYIKTEYVKHILNFSDTQFDLQYIKITTESTSASSILSSVNKDRNKKEIDIQVLLDLQPMMPLKNKNFTCTQLLLELQIMMPLRNKNVTRHMTCTQLLLELQSMMSLKTKI